MTATATTEHAVVDHPMVADLDRRIALLQAARDLYPVSSSIHQDMDRLVDKVRLNRAELRVALLQAQIAALANHLADFDRPITITQEQETLHHER